MVVEKGLFLVCGKVSFCAGNSLFVKKLVFWGIIVLIVKELLFLQKKVMFLCEKGEFLRGFCVFRCVKSIKIVFF